MPLTVEERKELEGLEDVFGQGVSPVEDPVQAIDDQAGVTPTGIKAIPLRPEVKKELVFESSPKLSDTENEELKALETQFSPDAPARQRQFESTIDEFTRALARGTLNVGSGLLSQLADVSREAIFDAEKIQDLADRAREASKKPEFQPGKDGGVRGFVANAVGDAIPFMAGVIAATIAGGPVAGFAVAYSVEGKNAYFDALDGGATQEQAEIEGFVVGSINAALELLQVERVIKFAKFGKGAVKEIAKAAKKKALKKVLAAGGKIGKEALKVSVTEGIQEALQETTSTFAPVLTGRELQKTGKLKRILQSALGGAVVGPILGGAGAVTQSIFDGKTDLSRNDVKQLGVTEPTTTEERKGIAEKVKSAAEAEIKVEVAPVVAEPEKVAEPVTQEQEIVPEAVKKGKKLPVEAKEAVEPKIKGKKLPAEKAPAKAVEGEVEVTVKRDARQVKRNERVQLRDIEETRAQLGEKLISESNVIAMRKLATKVFSKSELKGIKIDDSLNKLSGVIFELGTNGDIEGLKRVISEEIPKHVQTESRDLIEEYANSALVEIQKPDAKHPLAQPTPPVAAKPLTPEVKEKVVPKVPEKPRKKTTSVIAKKLSDTLAQHGIAQNLNYDPISIEEEVKKAQNLVSSNPVEAKRVAFSTDRADNLLNNAVRLAYAEKMEAEGNWEEMARVTNWIITENTRLGKEIVVNRGFTGATTEYVKQVVAAKMDAVGKKFGRGKKGSGRKKAGERIKQEVAKVQAKTEAVKMNIANAQAFIESLRC